MNRTENQYTSYLLVEEMFDTIEVVKNFEPDRTKGLAKTIKSYGKLFLTGEGSSRIFPAKNARRRALEWGDTFHVTTDGARQASLYDLSEYAVFLASNSGKTKEVISLAKKLKDEGHNARFGLTANKKTMLEEMCNQTFILTCGWEQAIAATKSVVEQALFYESILWHCAEKEMPDMKKMSQLIEQALTLPIDPAIVDVATKAPTLYFAGYNDGVAEELTLKTNEITRKKSDYLEGTYAVHGVEEVLNSDDVVFVIDPIEEEVEKFYEVLVKGVGMKVIAIANRETPFITIRVPDAGPFMSYVYLCAGWNLLVEVGLALRIDLDKPERARKVGNEYILK